MAPFEQTRTCTDRGTATNLAQQALVTPTRVIGQVAQTLGGLREVVGGGMMAPPSPFNRRPGPNRRWSMVEAPVHLFLFVKVREGWGEDRDRYRALGLEFPKE